jgi:signal transduction histidine kinase
MQDIASHILDIVENSISAMARNIKISIQEDLKKDVLIIEIVDDGEALDKQFTQKMADPFDTTVPEKKVGSDLSLFAEAAKLTNGHLTIRTDKQKRSRITARFQHSHINRKPIGDLGTTLKMLITENPGIDVAYCHTKNGMRFRLDSRELRAQSRFKSLASSEGRQVVQNKLDELSALLGDKHDHSLC